MYLLAPTLLRIEPQSLRAAVRARFGNDLRRAGVFTELSLLGADTCLASAHGEGALGLLWGSQRGALQATLAALATASAGGDDPLMPFSFIATQPHLAGVFLAQRSQPVTRVAHLHPAADRWPRLLTVANEWLASCGRVLVGWVEESTADNEAHRSDWCMLQRRPASGASRCQPVREEAAVAATADDWLARVAAWRTTAATSPLVLAGAGEAWSFTAA